MKLTPHPLRPNPLPECVSEPAAMPRLDPRPMPALQLACPEPQDGTAQRYRKPLWRSFEQIEND